MPILISQASILAWILDRKQKLAMRGTHGTTQEGSHATALPPTKPGHQHQQPHVHHLSATIAAATTGVRLTTGRSNVLLGGGGVNGDINDKPQRSLQYSSSTAPAVVASIASTASTAAVCRDLLSHSSFLLCDARERQRQQR